MSKAGRKRLIVELAATAVAAPLFVVLLVLLHQQMILWWFAWPFLSVTYRIGTWMNSVFPPQGGGWFEDLGAIIVVELLPTLILIWMIMFGVVKMIEKLIKRKKRNA